MIRTVFAFLVVFAAAVSTTGCTNYCPQGQQVVAVPPPVADCLKAASAAAADQAVCDQKPVDESACIAAATKAVGDLAPCVPTFVCKASPTPTEVAQTKAIMAAYQGSVTKTMRALHVAAPLPSAPGCSCK